VREPPTSSVAHFEERKSPLARLQQMLHANPAMVPLIVLVG
jgi:fructose transport system permease protein